jgi:lipoprotein-anchoring transpeptidase ErfK/SrfK
VVLCGLAAPSALAQGGGTYLVQPGDNLSSIAARFGVTLAQLAAANGLSWNAWVYVGQSLMIPARPQPQPTSPSTPTPGVDVYVVQPGDTLTAIASRYRLSVAALLAANGLANANLIYAGQRLTIPWSSPVPAPPLVQPTPTPTPTPVPDYGAKWIDVNLSTQRLVAYAEQTPVFTATVSTGLPGSPTLVGTFQIYVKYPLAPMTGPDYYLPDVPWVMYFYRDYSLHGTYWHNSFGTPMSHGCVNLSTPDAEWLYKWAEVGTTVVTHY